MKEEDKSQAEELIKYLQENGNLFSRKSYDRFPWLKTDKPKRSRIINELSSKGIFDKECTKSGKPKLDEKGWKYFEEKEEVRAGNTYNIGDNAIFQSEIKDSSISQVSSSNSNKSKINVNQSHTTSSEPQYSIGQKVMKFVLNHIWEIIMAVVIAVVLMWLGLN